jgi:hypothetical protein
MDELAALSAPAAADINKEALSRALKQKQKAIDADKKAIAATYEAEMQRIKAAYETAKGRLEADEVKIAAMSSKLELASMVQRKKGKCRETSSVSLSHLG